MMSATDVAVTCGNMDATFPYLEFQGKSRSCKVRISKNSSSAAGVILGYDQIL